MAHLNIEKVSLASRDREKEEHKKNFRKKAILLLIHHYLKENGYVETADTLSTESRFSIDDYLVCDNIHLDTILQDYESYHFLKYQKLPILIKKNTAGDMKLDTTNKNHKRRLKKMPAAVNSQQNSTSEVTSAEPNFITINQMHTHSNRTDETIGECDVHLLEPLGSFSNYTSEWKAMAEHIMQGFGKHDKSTTFSDIVGHDRAKQLLKEAVVYPLKYANVFQTVLLSWQSILLYGPSGTGKTLLATAAAAESNANLFRVCCSTIVSKWRGESEKLIKVLFDLAKHYAPSIIFIDEIDALISQRGADHEASRRTKTEFFLQMDALASCNKLVVLLGATNMPWELDHALLRRMEKRVLVSLPDVESRLCLFERFLSFSGDSDNNRIKMDLNCEELVNASDMYSAFDIQLVCKEAKMACLRRHIDCLENRKSNGVQSLSLHSPQALKVTDILESLAIIKPAATQLIEKYMAWRDNYGAE